MKTASLDKPVEVSQTAVKQKYEQENISFDALLLTEAQIPTGMNANDGYEGGAWDTKPDSQTPISEDKEYTYTFKLKEASKRPPCVGGSITPSGPEEKPEIEKNPDGSVTETVKKEDGTVIATTTKKDGSVSAEVTVPAGKKDVTVSIPKKDLKPGEVAVIMMRFCDMILK